MEGLNKFQQCVGFFSLFFNAKIFNVLYQAMKFSLQCGGWLTNGRDCGNNFSQFELVQDGGLSSSIQSYHQDPHLLLSKQFTKKASKISHLVSPAGGETVSLQGLW